MLPLDSRMKWPRNQRAAYWVIKLGSLDGGTELFNPTDPFARDYLADQAMRYPDPEMCESCNAAVAQDLVNRYEGQQVRGLQN
jgi:hypothetical protein